MTRHPAIVVHGLADVQQALAARRPVTLLSAPGAGLYAGCLWWRSLIAQAQQLGPRLVAADILDCADAPGRALEALRIGQRIMVLAPEAPGRDAVAAIASLLGVTLLAQRPPALDLAQPDAARTLEEWLRVTGQGA